jgi:ubiquinone/menaquinone biosynthesis C-methylase UbiE
MSDTQTPTSSYKASDQAIGLDREIERLRSQALITWPKEIRNLQWWGLRNGMSVLEVGSGPGFVTKQLLDDLPNSHVTALEIDPVLIEKARNYLGHAYDSRFEMVEGNVMSTGFPDDTFDFVYARYLFQHLPDPVGAAKELKRVLKPGGKLAIFDVDDHFTIFDPEGSAEMQALDKQISQRMQAKQAEKGGNRLISRRLVHVLRDAGFENRELEAVAIHSSLIDISIVVPKFTREDGERLVKDGFIDEAQLEFMLDEVALFEASDPVIMICTFMACGQKA